MAVHLAYPPGRSSTSFTPSCTRIGNIRVKPGTFRLPGHHRSAHDVRMIQGVRQFRDQYWERGAPGRETPAALTKQLYQLWLVGLLLKLIGSSWDVSWHFKWLRDDLAPPHLINTVGTVIVVGLTLFHTFTGYGGDKPTIRLMQVGSGIFL